MPFMELGPTTYHVVLGALLHNGTKTGPFGHGRTEARKVGGQADGKEAQGVENMSCYSHKYGSSLRHGILASSASSTV